MKAARAHRRLARTEPTEYACLACEKALIWDQPGSIPERCVACATEHKHALVTGTDTNTPWDITRAHSGDLYERLMAVLHWSPSINRWLYHDGNRWVKAVHVEEYGVSSEPYRVVLAVLRELEEVPRASPLSGSRVAEQRKRVDGVMADYRERCVRRAQ